VSTGILTYFFLVRVARLRAGARSERLGTPRGENWESSEWRPQEEQGEGGSSEDDARCGSLFSPPNTEDLRTTRKGPQDIRRCGKEEHIRTNGKTSTFPQRLTPGPAPQNRVVGPDGRRASPPDMHFSRSYVAIPPGLDPDLVRT